MSEHKISSQSLTSQSLGSAPASAASIRAAVLVAALGYFVDVYDIALFGIVRVSSLTELGLDQAAILRDGVFLLDMQMGGMLIGGILWGVLGDKWGRLQVLFGSILVYSVANLLNAFVTDVSMYAVLRMLAGIGLAGEIGAGITLVSEMMPKERRGLATTVVATVGVFGSVVAALVGRMVHWRMAYIIGGVGGLLLLALRVGVHESGMFSSVKDNHHVSRGDIRLLLEPKRLWRYVSCILVGTPMFFFIVLISTLSPELGRALGLSGDIVAATSLLCYSIGLTMGDLASGLVSQYLRSRRAALALFLSGSFIFSAAILFSQGRSPNYFYALLVPGGFCIGYWCILVTTSAEQFGTNLRATVASTVPNFVRGMTIPITFAFQSLQPQLGTVGSVRCVGIICFLLSAVGVLSLRETYTTDLNFLELPAEPELDSDTDDTTLPEPLVGNM